MKVSNLDTIEFIFNFIDYVFIYLFCIYYIINWFCSMVVSRIRINSSCTKNVVINKALT